jgi:hypothetical protein
LRDLIQRWQLLHPDHKIRVLYSLLKALLGFLAVVVASEYVSKALTSSIPGSWAIYYGEAVSMFILGSIAMRESVRALMVLRAPTLAPEPEAPLVLENEPVA